MGMGVIQVGLRLRALLLGLLHLSLFLFGKGGHELMGFFHQSQWVHLHKGKHSPKKFSDLSFVAYPLKKVILSVIDSFEVVKGDVTFTSTVGVIFGHVSPPSFDQVFSILTSTVDMVGTTVQPHHES